MQSRPSTMLVGCAVLAVLVVVAVAPRPDCGSGLGRFVASLPL